MTVPLSREVGLWGGRAELGGGETAAPELAGGGAARPLSVPPPALSSPSLSASGRLPGNSADTKWWLPVASQGV